MSDQYPPPPPGQYPPQGGQPYGFPPQQPQKKSKTLRNVIIGVILLLILFCGGCFALVGFGANEAAKEIDKAIESATATDTTDEPAPSEDEPTKDEDPEPEPEPEPEPAKWKTVGRLSGDTNKAGPDFRMNGCEARVKYDIQGSDPLVVGIYVLESGTKLMEDGGFPIAQPDKPGKGETSLRNDEGDYYIEVIAANASFNIQVQEKC